jgi:hypothetical protein
MNKYEVTVGNVGLIIETTNRENAVSEYEGWIAMSKHPRGRASGEDVTLWEDGEPIQEYNALPPPNVDEGEKLFRIPFNVEIGAFATVKADDLESAQEKVQHYLDEDETLSLQPSYEVVHRASVICSADEVVGSAVVEAEDLGYEFPEEESDASDN